MSSTRSCPIIVLALFALVCLQTNGQTDLQTAQKFLHSKASELQLQASDYECLILKNQYRSKNSGVSNHYFAQCHEGIEVYNAIFNIHFTPDGKLLTWGSRLVPGLKAKIVGTSPVTTQEEAVRAAAQQLGYNHQAPLVVKEAQGGVQQEVVFEKNDLSVVDIPVRLMYQPMPDGSVRLAWSLNLQEASGAHWWDVRVDAATGIILDKNDWVVTCDFGHAHQGASCEGSHFTKTKENAKMSMASAAMAGVYNVYPEPVESPSHGARQLISDPDDPFASPFGWHDTNGAAGAEFTITRGNNVYAQLDDDDNNGTFGFAPDGGASLVFDFPIDLTQPPSSYASAAITNLFYWNNLLHDLSYRYGFDEPSGNFQENNYGNGGAGSDDVIADAQDAGGINNANFATPPDGSNPRMQMYLWNLTSPERDGDLDNGIIAHEYGHGISIRQTGGPANSGCLNNEEQMGEGWSDYWSLMTTIEPGDMGADSRGIGTYALGQPPTGNGIRPTPYTTNMAINPTTYGDIGGLAVPHGVGYAWCTMIWEMTWGIIEQEGMQMGYNVAMNIVNEGLKLQPCSPGFVDGRDAILAADQAIYGGAHACTIWTAFAKRGLGFSATQGSSNNTNDGTEAFDMPPACTLDAVPTSLSICQPANAEYMIIVGTGNGNVTLSTTAGVPAGAVVNFSVNPVPPGGTSTMTISNTAAIVPGTYTITVQGVGTSFTNNIDVTLAVHGNVPAVPTLVSPADNATNIGLLPTLRWATIPSVDTFTVEVATDPAFSMIVETGQALDTAYALATQLMPLTVYYWRAKAENTCGESAFSTAFSFTTGNIACNAWASNNVPVTIPTTVATVTSTLNITQAGEILDVNVTNLNITHTWIDDLIVQLTSPDGTTVTLIDRPCDDEDNIIINFDDEAPGANYPCPPTNNGTYQPFSPLSAFDGEELSGLWTLTILDVVSADGGTLNSWSLDICYVPAPPPPPCTGPPTPGNTVSSANPTCVGSDFTLSLSGSPIPASDLAYQWQSSPDNINWNDIAAATGTELTTNQSTTTWYRCEVACTNTQDTVVATPLEVASQLCYCGAGATNTGFEKISRVQFNTLDNSSTSTAGYEDFTAINTVVHPDSSYGFTGTISNPFPDDEFIVWIDLNQDGDFTDPGEELFNSPTGLGPHSGTITIPGSALAGPTRMRVRMHDAAFGPNATPCGNSSYGQVEDYTVVVVPNCTPTNWYADGDGDGYGDAAGTPVMDCIAPPGHVSNADDCDDTNMAINPAATEICNNLDDDCSGSPEASSNAWTGDGDGTTWTDPDNWSDGIVPLECQHLAIPDGANVTVPDGMEAKGLTLEVATGALLTVPATAVLTIVNP